MAKPGLSFENPLYQTSGGTPVGFANPYTGVNPAASSGSDALQRGLADIAVMGQSTRQQFQTQFSMPGMQTPARLPEPEVLFSPSARKFYVNGVEFAEDDDAALLRSEALLDRPSVGKPQGGDWVPVGQDVYRGYIEGVRSPGIGRLMSKSFGRGVDQLQMLAGRGLQLAGAEQLGAGIVEQQEQDLARTAPYERQFTDIESGRGAVEWFLANLAQQGPNLIESVALGLAGAAAGTAAAGPVGTAVGGLAGFFGKKAFKDKVLDAAQKVASGQAKPGSTEYALLRNTAAVAGATAANFASNIATGAADIYGEMREQGVGPEDFGARLTALAGSLPYAGLDTVGEYFIASRLLGGSGRAALPKDVTTGQRAAEYGKRFGIGFGVGAPLEGTTEALQEGLVMGLSGQDLTSDEAINRFINSFAAGAAIGGPFGGVANLKSRNPDGTPSAEAKDEINLLTPPTLPLGTPPGTQGELFPVSGAGLTPGIQRGMQGELFPGASMQQPVGVPPQPAAPGVVGAQGELFPLAQQDMFDQMATADRIRAGIVPSIPAAIPGQQGLLNLFGDTGISPQELATRMQPQQLLPGLPAPTPAVQPDPRQGALQFAGAAPTAPANTQMGNQLQVIQDRIRRQREFEAAQAQQAALIQQQTEALAQQSANARDLYDMQQAQQAAAAQQTMPMRQAGPTQPVQLDLFNRRQAPVPSRAEGLRRGVGTGLPASTVEVPQTAAQRRAQVPLITQEGQPSVAALRSAGVTTKVAPAAPKAPVSKPRTQRGLKKQAGVAAVEVKEKPSAVQKRGPAKVPVRQQPKAGEGVRVGDDAGGKSAPKGEALKAKDKKQRPSVPAKKTLKKEAPQQRITNARSMGQSNAITALDQQGEFETLQAAVDTYRDNVVDTLNEQQELDRAVIDAALDAFDKYIEANRPKKEAPQPPKAVAAPAAPVESEYTQQIIATYDALTDVQKAAVASELDLTIDEFNDADALRTRTDDVDDAIAAIKRREKDAARRAPAAAKAALAQETPQERWDAFALPGVVSYADLPQAAKDAWDASDRSEAMQITIVDNILEERYAISPAEAFNFSVAATESARSAGDLDMLMDALGIPNGIIDSALFVSPEPNTRGRIAEAQAYLDGLAFTDNQQKTFADAFVIVALRQLKREAYTKGDSKSPKSPKDDSKPPESPKDDSKSPKSPKPWFTMATNLGVLRQLAAADMEFLGMPIDVAQTLINEGKITLNNLPDSTVKALNRNKPTPEQAAGATPPRSPAVKLAAEIHELNRSTIESTTKRREKIVAELTDLYAKAMAANLDLTQPDALLGRPIADFFDKSGKPITNTINGKLRVGTKKLTEAEITALETQMREERKAQERLLARAEDEVVGLTEEDRTKARRDAKKQASGARSVSVDPLDAYEDFDHGGRMFTADGKPIKAPVNMGRVRMAVSRFLNKLRVKPTVSIYKNQADLKAKNPALYAQAMASRPQGDFDTADAVGFSFGDGNVIIFSDRIATEDQLNFVLAHETLGHFGLRSLIPAKQFDALMESIYDQSQAVRDAADAAMMTRGLPKAEAVEEYLADAAAILDTSLVNRIFNAIKNALNKLGVKFADDAARYWVNQARRYIRHGERPSFFVTSEVMRRINDIEGGLDPDNTGRFALRGTLRGDNMLYEFTQDTNGRPTDVAEAAKLVRDAVGDSANSAEKFKTKFFGLLTFRARENPGLAALEEVLSRGRAFAMSIKNAANEKMAPVLDRAIASFAAGWAGVGGVTEAQTAQVNKMLYDAQRYATARLKMSDLTKTPLFSIGPDGSVLLNEPEFERVYNMGKIEFEQARDGYSYNVTYLGEAGKEVTETVKVAGDPTLDKDGVVWQGYERTREAVRDTHKQLLRVTYASFTADRDLAFREIGDATVAKKLTGNDQKFLERMYRKYRDLYTADQLVDDEGNPSLNPKSLNEANDFIEALNTAILGERSDRNAAVAKFFDTAVADDVSQSIEEFKKSFVKTEENKFLVQNKIKQIVLEDMSNNGADLATKVTLARGYAPYLRKGNYQTRVEALDASGRVVRLAPGYKEQLVFSQVETESDAVNLTAELNKTFGKTVYNAMTYSETERAFVLTPVTLRAKAEAALSEVAAPPELNLNEFVRGIGQFNIALNPTKMKEIVLALTRQNASARNRLLRAFTPGASPDALAAISQHIESRASVAAKILMRPKINELMNLNMSSTQKLWNGDKAKLDQLKANFERAMADPQASAEERKLAATEYDMYNMQYTKTNPAGGAARGNMYYDEGSRAVAFLNDNRDVNESDFGSGKTASSIRAYTSLLQLGGSLATASLNYVGAIVNGIPFLATYNKPTSFGGGFGFARSMAAFYQALSQVGMIRALPGIGQKGLNTAQFYEDMVNKPSLLAQYGLTSGEARFLAREIREGVMIPALSNSMMNSARGRMSYAGMQKTMDGIMWTFNSSEQAVRRALGLAAYRLQFESNMGAGQSEADAASAARDFAVSTLNYTVGEYSVMNRPAVWRSGIQSFLYMYKVFPTTTIQLLARLPREGQVYMLMTLFLMGGLAAFPFAEDIEDLIDTIGQALGWKSGGIRLEIAKVVDQLVPGASPYFLRGFVNPLLGIEVASRISSGDFMPGTGMFLAGADKGREAFEILGPAASMLSGAGTFITRLLQSGFTDRVTLTDALRESPMTMMRAFGDAISYGQTGAVVDKRGYVVSPDAHAGTIAARMLGFYPGAASEQYQIIRASKRVVDYQRETTAGFRAAWIKAELRGDKAQAKAVVDAVRDWNEGAKGSALEIRNFLANSQRALREAQRPAKERLLRSAPKAAKDELEQVADLLGYND